MSLFRKLTRKLLAPSRPTYRLAGRDYQMRLREPDLTPAIEMRILRIAEALEGAETLLERQALLGALVCDMYLLDGDEERVMRRCSYEELLGASGFFMQAWGQAMENRIAELGRLALR